MKSGIAVMGFVLLLGLAGPTLSPYKKVRNLMCSVSGSTRTEIEWFGYHKREVRTVSALEFWLRKREPGFKPTWQQRSRQTYGVLVRACGVGPSPEISTLTPVLDLVIETLSDKEIAALVDVLRNGSLEEQREMIWKVSDKVFEKK